LLLPIHLICLATAMARWQHGLPPENVQFGLSYMNPFIGRWHPPLGSVLPVFCELAGLAILGWLAWTACRRDAAVTRSGSDAGTISSVDPGGDRRPGIRAVAQPGR
jgi:hypothetical protein